MSTACGRLQEGGGLAHVDGGVKSLKTPIFVDIINGWPLTLRGQFPILSKLKSDNCRSQEDSDHVLLQFVFVPLLTSLYMSGCYSRLPSAPPVDMHADSVLVWT